MGNFDPLRSFAAPKVQWQVPEFSGRSGSLITECSSAIAAINARTSIHSSHTKKLTGSATPVARSYQRLRISCFAPLIQYLCYDSGDDADRLRTTRLPTEVWTISPS